MIHQCDESSCFGIRILSFLRASTFVLRHFPIAQRGPDCETRDIRLNREADLRKILA